MDPQQENNNNSITRRINKKYVNKMYRTGKSKIKYLKPHLSTQAEINERWQNTQKNMERANLEMHKDNLVHLPNPTPNKTRTKYPPEKAVESHGNPNSRVTYSRSELLKIRESSKLKCEPPLQTSTPSKLICQCPQGNNGRNHCSLVKKNIMGIKSYKIMHHNTGGLTRETITEINHQLEVNEIDILCLNETKLKPNRQLTLYGYNCIARKDRQGPTAGGGVAIYAKSSIRAEQIEFRTEEELVVITMTTHRNSKFNIVSIYNPPDTELNIDAIRNVAGLNRKTIILGDLNAKDTRLNNNGTNRSGRRLMNLLVNTDLTIINNDEPTHVPWNGAPDRLDLALATPQLIPHIRDFAVSELDAIYGHAPITVTVAVEKEVAQATDRPPSYNYERANWDKFRNIITQKIDNNAQVQTPTQLENTASKLVKIIKEAADRSIPKSQHKKYSAKLPNWIGTLIRNRYTTRRVHQRERNQITRRRYNAAQREVQNAIASHNQNKWDKTTERLENQNDPRKFWALFNKLTKGKAPLEYSKLRNPATNTKPETDKEAAQIFNDQLHETMNRLLPNQQGNQTHAEVNTWFRDNLDRLKPLANVQENNEQHNLLIHFTEAEVINAIKLFKPRKAPGLDGIQMILYKELPENAIKQLTQIYNSALRLGYFPTHFKTAKVIMIPKPNKTRDNPRNYRPISLTNTIGKVLERLLHTRLMRHLQNINFLSNNQHGFKPKTGTADQMIKLMHQIKKEQRTRKSPLLAALDLEKAFDKVWHKGLLYKFSKIPNIPNTYVRLITSFLYQRKILTSVKNEQSTTFTPKAGVPQGSILSPLLFNIFVNDIQEIQLPPNTYIYQYADDTCVLSSALGGRHQTLQRRMNTALDKLYTYFENWKLRANPDKTQLIAVTQIKPRKIKSEVKIRFANTDIPFAPQLTLLGNIIKPTLNMDAHVKHVKAKASRAINRMKALNTAQSNMSIKTLSRLYKVLVRSVMEYCPQYTLLATEGHLQKLQKSQNRALRQAVRAHYYVPNRMVQELFPDVPPIKDRLQKLTAKYLRKTHNPEIAQIINEIAQTRIDRANLRPILYNQIH